MRKLIRKIRIYLDDYILPKKKTLLERLPADFLKINNNK